MKAVRLTLTALIVLIIFEGEARADAVTSPEEQTIRQMRDYCRKAEGSPWHMFCLGRISGWTDAVTLSGSAGRFIWGVCLPDGVTVGQEEKIFVKWADENPKDWHLPWVVGLSAALKEAFPCPK